MQETDIFKAEVHLAKSMNYWLLKLSSKKNDGILYLEDMDSKLAIFPEDKF